MALILTIFAITFFAGILVGCVFTERMLAGRTKRQAAMQRTLNEQWQELNAHWQLIASNSGSKSGQARAR